MARARTLKPAFFTDETLALCSPIARLLFAGLWTIADRDGKLRDRPRQIRAELFPYEAVPDANEWLEELTRSGLIVRYVVNEEGFIKIPGFAKHQHPHPREQPSEFPEPDLAAAGRGKALSSPSLSPLPITHSPIAVTEAVAGPGAASTAGDPAPWELFRDHLADRLGVARDWLRVASADRTATVRDQLDAELGRLGMARALEVAAEAAGRAKSLPRWLAYYLGPLQDASRLSAPQDSWQDGPRSETWRDDQGRSLSDLQDLDDLQTSTGVRP